MHCDIEVSGNEGGNGGISGKKVDEDRAHEREIACARPGKAIRISVQWIWIGRRRTV